MEEEEMERMTDEAVNDQEPVTENTSENTNDVFKSGDKVLNSHITVDTVESENFNETEKLKERLDNRSTLRFSSAIWFKNLTEKKILIAGIGGIGSWTALLISKLQPAKLIMYDDDNVEGVNMAGQLYSEDVIGEKKVNSLYKTIDKFSGYKCFAMPERFTSEVPTYDIMIGGFDNMSSRQLLFNAWEHHVNNSGHPENCLFIDGRMAAEEFQVFCIQGDEMENRREYSNNYLFNDTEAEETICSYKQTAFVANIIAGIITNLLVNFSANQCNPPIPRPVPFKISYNAEFMNFKIEG